MQNQTPKRILRKIHNDRNRVCELKCHGCEGVATLRHIMPSFGAATLSQYTCPICEGKFLVKVVRGSGGGAQVGVHLIKATLSDKLRKILQDRRNQRLEKEKPKPSLADRMGGR